MMKDRFLTLVFLGTIFIMGMGTIASLIMSNNREIDFSNISTVSIEAKFDENIFFERVWIEVYGLYNKITDRNIVEDENNRYTVYKMDNNQLTWNYEYVRMDPLSKKYISFAKEVEKLDIPITYVQAPFKINKFDNRLPYEKQDTTNIMADEFIYELKRAECDVLDLRDVIEENALVHEELFFATDHHWTPEAGLWATGMIADYINSTKEILDTSYLQANDYNYEILENIFCGSQGKRTGILYSGLDDMTLITPSFSTKYQYHIPAIDYNKTGTYEECFLFYEYLEQGFLSDDVNRVYTGDNYSYSYMKNYNAKNDSSVLLIRDSFSRVVAPFMISACEELHIVDLRTYDSDLISLIREKEIDVVIVLYNPSVVVNQDFFEFIK